MNFRPKVRLEWIYLVYLTLFALAVTAPSIIERDFLGIPAEGLEEILIFLFGIAGIATFSIYQRLMERKDKEHQDTLSEYERARKELVGSYRYIGSINRQVEVLKGMANETSQSIMENQKLTKELMETLLANAATTLDSKTGMLRFMELEKLRTVHEIHHPFDGRQQIKIHNKDLKEFHVNGTSHAFMNAEDGRDVLVVSSDGKRPIKAYIVLKLDPTRSEEPDISLLKVFANQANLLYHALGQSKSQTSPLDLVKETEDSVVGEVG